MNSISNAKTGGQLIVDMLSINGVDTVFQIPGESFLSVLDGLYDVPEIKVITCRHESGAANMAEAYGKLTGRPGICFVTRGPGASHAAVGVHTADQDSTPMILFVGQVPTDFLGRKAFQEIDIEAMFGWAAKWAANIPSAEAIPEYIARAFALSASGRPGPVVLGLPEDIQTAPATGEALAASISSPPEPRPAELRRLTEIFAGAERPMMIIGGSGWTQVACDQMMAFAKRTSLPTCVSFRRQDHFDNAHPCYVGDIAFTPDPDLSKALEDADVILAVGSRLGELTSGGYETLAVPTPQQTLIHIHTDAAELGRVYQADLAIQAGPLEMAAALSSLDVKPKTDWAGYCQTLRSKYEKSRESWSCPGEVDMRAVIAAIETHADDDTIIATDAGNFASWPQRFYPYRTLGTQLGPRNGAMGYGVPAAVAAKAVYPDRQVIGFAGDGGFMMTANEIATAVQFRLNPVIIVVNNGIFGTIRMHQERHFPGRVSGTDLNNPDFAAMAVSMGANGVTVAKTEEFSPALVDALASRLPTVLDVALDLEAITPTKTLSEFTPSAS